MVRHAEMPSALVTDIATDPNGRVLQIATGRPSVIYVIVPVDGTLRLATGTVFDFYQFEQPLSDRMTDTEWRQRIGVWMSEEGTYNWKAVVEKPWWTASYRVWSRTAITRTDEKRRGWLLAAAGLAAVMAAALTLAYQSRMLLPLWIRWESAHICGETAAEPDEILLRGRRATVCSGRRCGLAVRARHPRSGCPLVRHRPRRG